MDIKQYLLDFYISHNGEKITPDLAKMIVEDFAVTDNSGRPNGEKWTMEECSKLGESMGVDWSKIDKVEWYIVLNNEYSDKYIMAKKHGWPEPSIYGEFAMSWFNDVDAKENKTFKYFFS